MVSPKCGTLAILVSMGILKRFLRIAQYLGGKMCACIPSKRSVMVSGDADGARL